jgi:HK97 family phage major capsid protein
MNYQLQQAINEADRLSRQPVQTKESRARISVLLAQIAAAKNGSVEIPNKASEEFFRALVRGENIEQRGNTMLAGTNDASNQTQGSAGGYLVPTEFADSLILGLAQVDPLLDENVVTLKKSATFALRPYGMPGWDLSSFAAVKVGEATQQTPQTVPTASHQMLNGYQYRASLTASFELEEDDFQPVIDQFTKAYSIGFARGIGADLVNGNGSTAPQGVLSAASFSGYTTATGGGVITATDIDEIYFGVNVIYRNAPKCAWVMSDTTYKAVRQARDANGRPLINMVDDREMLMGKPVRISPSMPSYNASTGAAHAIIFGDMSHYVVRVSAPLIQRSIEGVGMVETGIAQYRGLIRADAKLVDPSGNAVQYSIVD